jgi:hypothetical protein
MALVRRLIEQRAGRIGQPSHVVGHLRLGFRRRAPERHESRRRFGALHALPRASAALRDVYRGITAWWYEHQRPPATDAELREAYPALADDPGFAIGLTPLSNGGMCVHVAPRTQPPSAAVLSLDIGGNVYAGDGCAGTPVDRAYR